MVPSDLYISCLQICGYETGYLVGSGPGYVGWIRMLLKITIDAKEYFQLIELPILFHMRAQGILINHLIREPCSPETTRKNKYTLFRKIFFSARFSKNRIHMEAGTGAASLLPWKPKKIKTIYSSKK